jgi:hypothetical protein
MENKRAYYWIKLNTAYLSNSKFLHLDAKAKSYYFLLYLLACECDSGGLLIQDNEILSIDDLALLLHSDINDLAEAIAGLLQSGLVTNDNGFVITRFIDEQGPKSFGEKESRQREEWRERQTKSRDKKAKAIDKDNIRKEEDKEEERDIDKIRRDIDIDKSVTRDKTVTENQEPNDSFSLSVDTLKTKDTFSLAIKKEVVQKINIILNKNQKRELDDFLIFQKGISINLHELEKYDIAVYPSLLEAVNQFIMDHPEPVKEEESDFPF